MVYFIDPLTFCYFHKIYVRGQFACNIKFVKVDNLFIPERLREMNNSIADHLSSQWIENSLIICPNRSDVDMTISELNTKLMLGSLNNVLQDNNILFFTKENVRFIDNINSVDKYRTIIFKGLNNLSIFDFYNISNKKNVLFFETGDQIEFLSTEIFK